MRIVFLIILCVFCFNTQVANGQELSEASEKETFTYIIGSKILQLKDENNSFSIEQILREKQKDFAPCHREFPSFGIQSVPFWLHFKVLAKENEKLYLRILNPLLDSAKLYVFANDSLLMEKELVVRKYEKQIPFSAFALPILAQKDSLDCYVKVSALAPLIVPIQLIEESKLADAIFFPSTFDLLSMGSILIMAIYNLFIGFATRNRAYLFYVGYSIMLLLTLGFFRSYPLVFFGPSHYLIDDYFGVISSSVSIWLGLFIIEFLNLKTRYPLGYKLIITGILLHVAICIVFLMGYVQLNVLLFQPINLFSIATVFFCSLKLTLRGYAPARLFLVAFSVFMIGITVINLTFLDIVPYHELLPYYIQISSVIELTLFSLALANKIALYRKEKDLAQKQTIELIQNQNVILEGKVTQRTLELKEANEELNSTLDTVEKQRDNILASINYAKRIQLALLPSKELLQKRLRKLTLLYLPKDIVSGDFYWHAELEGKQFLACADCTGHGVPGAFMTVIGINLLEQIVLRDKIQEPAQILKELDVRLLSLLKQSEQAAVNDGMDISFLRIDEQNKEIVWASAKRPLWILNTENEEITEYKGDKFPIGSTQFANKEFTQQAISLGDKQWLVTFTDGFPDQFNGSTKYMLKNFRSLLGSIKKLHPKAQENAMEQALEAWKGNTKQTDDVLVMGFMW